MPEPTRFTSPGSPDIRLSESASRLDAALLRAGDPGADAEPIERALLDYATHPGGAGASEAWLLAWNASASRFGGWSWAGAGGTRPLAEALDLARPARPDPERQERVARLRRRTFELQALGTVPGRAWSSGHAATGPADADAGLWPAQALLYVVPVRRGNAAHGLLIAVGSETEVDGRRLALLEHAAASASAALAVQARAQSERLRAMRAGALAEMARASVSAMNVAEAQHLATRLAARVTGARGSAAWRVHGDTLRLEVTHGPAGQRERIARELMGEAREATLAMTPRVLDPGAEGAAERTVTSAGIVPLVAYGHPRGALGVWEKTSLHPAEPDGFDAADMEFLHTLGDLLAMSLDHAARFDALRAAEREREELRARVRREERLAAAGEFASRAAREVRNPIAAVAAFARRARREMKPDDPLREYLEIVLREIDRIDRITREQLALAEMQPPRLSLENVNVVVGRALQRAGEPLVRRRIRLLKKLAADLPALLLDPERMERVIGNIVGQAVDAVPLGGRVRVETRRAGGFVVIEVAHDGAHDPGAMMEQLFAPFAPAPDGAGVGLGVARQVIHEHGGEIRVRADVEWSTVLTLTLPVLENDDRRRPGADRRRPRRDRRRGSGQT